MEESICWGIFLNIVLVNFPHKSNLPRLFFNLKLDNLCFLEYHVQVVKQSILQNAFTN